MMSHDEFMHRLQHDDMPETPDWEDGLRRLARMQADKIILLDAEIATLKRELLAAREDTERLDYALNNLEIVRRDDWEIVRIYQNRYDIDAAKEPPCR